MPHAFYIGSKMATMRRLKPEEYGEVPAMYESGDAASDDEYDDDDVWQKKHDARRAQEGADAVERPARSRAQRIADTLAAPFSTVAAARRRGESPPPPRPFLPSLHLPHPVNLGALGFDLGALTRARPRSPVDDERDEDGIEELRRGDDARNDGEGRTCAGMDVVAKTRSLTSAAAGAKASSRSRPRRRPTLACVEAHLTHASLDIAGSLLGFAVVVNSAILILGAAVFYYGDGRSSNPDGGGVSDLFDAYDLVKQYLGQGASSPSFSLALSRAFSRLRRRC